jgi:hypothetical protein
MALALRQGMRTLATLLLAVVFLAGCGDDTPTSPTSGPAIALTGNLAFGDVAVGSTATATLTINNGGNAPLNITSIGYPAGFSGNLASGAVPAGASQTVTVTFAPSAAQAYTGTITVNGDHRSGTNTIAASGTGFTVPTFTLSGMVTEAPPTTSIVLAGVKVTILDGANAGKTATTGADGRYQITGVVNGGYTVTATLANYLSASLPVGIDGNTTLNFRLEPSASRTMFGAGQYRVGLDIPVGRYYSDPASGCEFQRLRGFGGSLADVIVGTAINFDAGQWIVDLLATDLGFQTNSHCGMWFTTPRGGLQSAIAPGIWIVGAQVAPGTYRAENSRAGCLWQRLQDFSGSAAGVIASSAASNDGPQLVTIASRDAGFRAGLDCGTWTRMP